jgi:hypothetical protein
MQIQTARQPIRNRPSDTRHGLRRIGAFMPDVLARRGIDPDELIEHETARAWIREELPNGVIAGIGELSATA